MTRLCFARVYDGYRNNDSRSTWIFSRRDYGNIHDSIKKSTHMSRQTRALGKLDKLSLEDFGRKVNGRKEI